MLRSVPQAALVAGLLADAWSQATGVRRAGRRRTAGPRTPRERPHRPQAVASTALAARLKDTALHADDQLRPRRPCRRHMPRGPLLAIGALLLVDAGGRGRACGCRASSPQPDAARRWRTRSCASKTGPTAASPCSTPRAAGRSHAVQGESRLPARRAARLARERRSAASGPEPPFELIARADGRLTLADPATGERVDLESFGPTNAGVFARLLTAAARPGALSLTRDPPWSRP